MGQQHKTWLGRNWKWFIPILCLGSLISCAGCFALFMSLIFGMMKSSDAYQDALAKAKANPVVQKAIGTPIEEGMFVTGEIKTSNSSGKANLSIPISGPDGQATIYFVASKSAGEWTFSTLVVEITENKQRINLLE